MVKITKASLTVDAAGNPLPPSPCEACRSFSGGGCKRVASSIHRQRRLCYLHHRGETTSSGSPDEKPDPTPDEAPPGATAGAARRGRGAAVDPGARPHRTDHDGDAVSSARRRARTA